MDMFCPVDLFYNGESTVRKERMDRKLTGEKEENIEDYFQ